MTTVPERPLPDVTVDWLDAVLTSASVDTIGVTNWWPRATNALATAAATADTYGHAVALACGKLQIDVLSTASARTLAALEVEIGPRLAEWRTVAEREAEYIVALTRLRRQSKSAMRKEAAKAPQPAGRSVAPAVPAATAEEAMF